MNSERINKYACSQVRCQTLFIPSDRWLSERVSTRVTSYRISPRYGSKAQMIVPFDDDEGDVQTTCVRDIARLHSRSCSASCMHKARFGVWAYFQYTQREFYFQLDKSIQLCESPHRNDTVCDMPSSVCHACGRSRDNVSLNDIARFIILCPRVSISRIPALLFPLLHRWLHRSRR